MASAARNKLNGKQKAELTVWERVQRYAHARGLGGGWGWCSGWRGGGGGQLIQRSSGTVTA